jgi:hypothetical protein
MKANLVTSFAAGLLVSAGVCAVVYFSEPSSSDNNSEKSVQAPNEEEMIATLSSTGYIILTNEEWNKQLSAIEEKDSDESEEKATEQTEDKVEEKIVYRTIVNVAQGMTSIDVGNALVQGKIIDNARTFFNEVEKRGLSNQLKPGTFELDSDMTLDEVMNIIFK